jgi:hypothetical protein
MQSLRTGRFVGARTARIHQQTPNDCISICRTEVSCVHSSVCAPAVHVVDACGSLLGICVDGRCGVFCGSPDYEFGARPDGATINTKAIQAAIDHLASRRGGTVVIPQGTFVSGALFFKPKVNLHLRAGAVLQCSTDMANFPAQRTRIEGHFEEKFNPALINAKTAMASSSPARGRSMEQDGPYGTCSGNCATRRPRAATSRTWVFPAPAWRSLKVRAT